MKQLLNSPFVGYEEFCRSRRMLSTSASVDNTHLDLQNSSYPTQPHSIIAKYPESLFSEIATFVLHIAISSKGLKETTIKIVQNNFSFVL